MVEFLDLSHSKRRMLPKRLESDPTNLELLFWLAIAKSYTTNTANVSPEEIQGFADSLITLVLAGTSMRSEKRISKVCEN